MEPRYLLDTNICIYIRQNRPEEVLRRFRKLRPGEAALSVITYGELFYGAAKSARRELTAYAADLAVGLAQKQIRIDAATDQALVRNFAGELGAPTVDSAGKGGR